MISSSSLRMASLALRNMNLKFVSSLSTSFPTATSHPLKTPQFSTTRVVLQNAQMAAKSKLSNKDSAMFCFQCEQTENASGCTTKGVCGKTPEVAHLQDGIVHALKSLAAVAAIAGPAGVRDRATDRFFLESLFSTLTNVNFDAVRCADYMKEALSRRDALAAAYTKATGKSTASIPHIHWKPKSLSPEDLEAAGVEVGVKERALTLGDNISGLQELIMYGIKGTAAYACHAMEAGSESDEIYDRIYRSTALLAANESDTGKLVAEAMFVGATNVSVMASLDAIHTARFGSPVPTAVNHAPTKGKCILISGHDLVDLEALLQQTEGKGINVYTHGEMLPAHGYPNLKQYKHFVGHFGTAWQLQKLEYAAFPGPIVQSTNCIMEPRNSYKNRLFTTNSTGWPGVTHIKNRDFTPVIQAALAADGFKETKPPKTMLTGFGHKAVLSVAPAILEAVAKGNLKRFVLIGGCDGSEIDRTYYTRLAMNLPQESVILTLGCAKYRILGKKDYGTVTNTGIPRVLDMGQCNDSYSAVVVATELAKALNIGINDLPLSLVLSWLEQKAVAVLLSLLSLGVQNIRIGPALPAFVTPSTLEFLVKQFNLQPIHESSPDGDVDAVMGLKK